jgi:hypothetical protein
MWQSPSSRTRAAQAAKKRERDRLKPHLRIQKVHAEIKVLGAMRDPQFADCQVVLNDFSPLGVSLFSNTPLMVGDEVALTLEQPKQFYIKGRIISCQEYDATSRVLSKNTYSYRIGIQFKFETDEEKAEVKAYCDHIAQQFLFGSKRAA